MQWAREAFSSDVLVIEDGLGRHLEHRLLEIELVAGLLVDDREGDLDDLRDAEREPELLGNAEAADGVEIGEQELPYLAPARSPNPSRALATNEEARDSSMPSAGSRPNARAMSPIRSSWSRASWSMHSKAARRCGSLTSSIVSSSSLRNVS